jgi:hypothetical protein
MAFRLDRAPLVDFCNQDTPRARPEIVRSPSFRGNERALAHAPADLATGEAAAPCAALGRSLARRREQPRENGWRRRSGFPRPATLAGGLSFENPCGMREPRPAARGDPEPSSPARLGKTQTAGVAHAARGRPSNDTGRAGASAEVSRARPAALTVTSRGFTGQGLACLAASSFSGARMRARFPALSHPRRVAREGGSCAFALAGDWEMPLPQPDPLGHLSS